MKKKNVSESIFNNGFAIIPMAEVSHIEKDGTSHETYGGYWVIFKHSRPAKNPRFTRQPLEPHVWVGGQDAIQFKKDWCLYRSQVEGII